MEHPLHEADRRVASPRERRPQRLGSVVEPARMLPSIEHKLAVPNDDELEFWSDLDILFSEKPRLSLGVAQFALLFLSETALERYWEFQDQLPVLFHALFMHLDHRQAFVQEHSRHMLFQLLRSCLTGYDELPDRPVAAQGSFGTLTGDGFILKDKGADITFTGNTHAMLEGNQ